MNNIVYKSTKCRLCINWQDQLHISLHFDSTTKTWFQIDNKYEIRNHNLTKWLLYHKEINALCRKYHCQFLISKKVQNFKFLISCPSLPHQTCMQVQRHCWNLNLIQHVPIYNNAIHFKMLNVKIICTSMFYFGVVNLIVYLLTPKN